MAVLSVVTLGTAGGPRWWHRSGAVMRAGISTAVVVGERNYLFDAGLGAGRQFAQAGLLMANLGGIFLTHLHSDHTTDVANLALFGLYRVDPTGGPIPILGPGDRGVLPPMSPRATEPPRVFAPELPTPGTADMFGLLMRAYATDLNDRILDSLRPSPHDLFRAEDIVLPEGIGYHPNEAPTPTMAPFRVFEDDRVRVDAILVEHPPIAPAFAYRLTSAEGSVVISGDTRPTLNMVTLAQGADLLLHEAISFDWVREMYADLSDPVNRASIDHHRKSHTSAVEAAELAAAAGVGTLALHHLVPGFKTRDSWYGELGLHRHVLIPSDLDVLPVA